MKEDEEEEGRDKWTNPAEFLLSCIAMSVGLGNIWRFPYIAYTNGGGAFLIPYIVVLSFIGRPLYFLEMILGQFSSSGSVKVWNVVPFARGFFNLNAIPLNSKLINLNFLKELGMDKQWLLGVSSLITFT